jgi:hypothetical protein
MKPNKEIKEAAKKAKQAFEREDSTDPQQHPLINPDSTHYTIMGDNFIDIIERMFTREELMAWAKITVWKYRARIGNKDDIDKEIKKIKTYEDYYNYLALKK